VTRRLYKPLGRPKGSVAKRATVRGDVECVFTRDGRVFHSTSTCRLLEVGRAGATALGQNNYPLVRKTVAEAGRRKPCSRCW
jgi:hypothetical protein